MCQSATLLALVTCVLIAAQPASAQSHTARALDYSRHAVYLELLGSAGAYSFNYEHRWRDDIAARVGFSVLGVGGRWVDAETNEPVGDGTVSMALLPLTASYLAGSGNHRFEVGAGPLLGFAGGDFESEAYDFSGFGLAGVTSTFGYRYQPRRGLFFRASLTPFYAADAPQLWGGLSLGYAF